jgi:hypothetical protein
MVMALYAALLHMPEGSDWMTAEVREEHRVFGAAASAVLGGAVALYPTGSASTITVAGGPGGDVLVTDGPYAEAKEVLIGLYVLEAADLDEAISWAARIPTAWHGKVQLRPVLPVGSTPFRQ